MALFSKKDWKSIVSAIIIALTIGSVGWCVAKVESLAEDTWNSKNEIKSLKKTVIDVNEKILNIEKENKNYKEKINSIKLSFTKVAQEVKNVVKNQDRLIKRSDDIYRIMLQFNKVETKKQCNAAKL